MRPRATLEDARRRALSESTTGRRDRDRPRPAPLVGTPASNPSATGPRAEHGFSADTILDAGRAAVELGCEE
jgi:hypothetical protein